MAMNYTVKFADKVDERFTPSTVTYNVVNQDYDFVGAKTVKVTSIDVVENGDYNRTTGYGAAKHLGNTIQELTMTKDRGFKIVLDKMDEEETKIKAGEVLARQLREKVIPEIEAYRIEKMLEASKSNAIPTAAKTTAYQNFLKAQEFLDDNDVPENRVALVSPAFLNELKLDPNFIKASDLGQKVLMKGQVGEVDGIAIIKTKKAWLKDSSSTTYHCLIAHKSATVAPVKLADYKVITDSEDYSGTVFLGRFYYDCFVLNNKVKAIVGIKTTA